MRWSAAMPSSLWMLFRSSAMSGSEYNSFRRWLREKTRRHLTFGEVSAFEMCKAGVGLYVPNPAPPVPADDSEQLASVVVGVEDFRFGLCCQYRHHVFKQREMID